MKLNYDYLPKELQTGMKLLARYGFIEHSQDGLIVNAVYGNQIMIAKSEEQITITYDTKPHFYMALSRALGMENGSHVIEPMVKEFGFMVDCSRNAVPKVEMLKELICLLVLTGYTYVELYTEDTYELPDEPYFGYKRGRYTRGELEEVVAFADTFDFTVVPCIQTLAHLNHLRQWKVYSQYMDIENILIVGDERTYQLIRKCLRFCKEVFHTNRINIGLDEATWLGRGKYTNNFGYKPKEEIFIDHLKQVFQMCKEEGFEPEFWADAFYYYGTEWDEEAVKALFDGSQTPIMWQYDSTDPGYYKTHCSTLRDYAGKVAFAGSYRKYIGYAPENSHTERAIDASFEEVVKVGVDDILMTAWGDNGGECSTYAVISDMWYSAQKIYPCKVDVNKVVEALTGYTSDEWKSCELLNHMTPGEEHISNAAKYQLHNDFLLGLMDYHVPDFAGELYERLLPDFGRLAKKDSRFSYIFQTYEALCKVLTRKSTYSKRLYHAYQNQDKTAMRQLIVELQDIKKDMEVFYDIFREQWMTENKGYGFEVMDVRIGGLIARTGTVTKLLENYLDGKTDRIYELEEGRLKYYSSGVYRTDEMYALSLSRWDYAFTASTV